MKEKSIDRDKILGKVRDYIKREGLICKGQRVLVAVSGGADSVCLLLLLDLLKDVFCFSLEAVTVDHGIRGEEALSDVDFVDRLCKARKIPLHICHVDVPALSKKESLSLEEAARKARYACFRKLAVERNMDAIAIAHHMEDSAETILHNLFRGSGLRGLKGLAPLRKDGGFTYIRPLLCLSRNEIEEWLRAKGASFVTDSTNSDEAYTRNYIRRQILPRIKEKVNKKADLHIKQAGDILGEAYLVIKDQAEEWFGKEKISLTENSISLPVDSLLKLRPIIRREIYLQVLDRFSDSGMLKDVSGNNLEKIDDLCFGREARTFEVLGKITIYRQYGRLYFYEKTKEIPVQEKSITSLPIEGTSDLLSLSCCESFDISVRIFTCTGEKIPENNYTKWMDYDTIKNGLSLRYRRQGDYFYLPGGGRKTLKSYLIDKKIPAKERDRFIVLADGNHVLWTQDGRLSAACKVTDHTKRVLEFIFKEKEK